MNIWLINHYAVPIQYYPLARTTNFAKYLMQMGHNVTIFAASSVHNSTVNLIQDNSLFREETVNDIHYVYIRCRSYTGNGIGRIINMFEFAFRLPKVCEQFSHPDVVMATTMTPLACMAGLRLAKKNGAKGIAEITDLCPENLVEYGFVNSCNPLLIPMYQFEKKMCKCADEIIFSLEGGYDYIKEHGWDKEIPASKVHYINNGVDLDKFDFNKMHYQIQDEDLENKNICKVIYTGSIRPINNLGKLLDVAKIIRNPKIRFLIWGKGDELPALKKRVENENIHNVIFKGFVDKTFIPYITSCADINIDHCASSDIKRFGTSPNKMFDYMAAGKPIFVSFYCKYDPVVQCGAGIDVSNPTVENIARALDDFVEMDDAAYSRYCQSARRGAEEYDFKNLTKKLLKVMTGDIANERNIA